jgi:hypothetical protein
MAQRLAHAFEPRARAYRRQHRRRVGALLAPRLEPATGAGLIQDQVEQTLRGLTGDQAGAQRAEHGVGAAGVGQLHAARRLPVQAAAPRRRGLPVGPPFHEWQHGDQCQTPGRCGGLPTRGEQIGEVVVAIEGAQRST